MRVAMVGPGPEEHGGIALSASTLLRSTELSAHEIRYFPSMGWGPPLRQIRKSLWGPFGLMLALAGGYRPELVHIHLSSGFSVLRKQNFVRIARSLGVPYVLHVHGPNMEATWYGSPLHRRVLTDIFGGAALVILLGHRREQIVRKWMRGDVYTAVLYNPAVTRELASVDRPYDRSPATVLFMGIIGGRKGAWDLLQAARNVVAAEPGTRFVFAGNGEVDRLKEEIRVRGLSGNVEAPGWVSGTDRLRAFADADVFCLPSYAEALPLSVAEAMASGLPVVSTDVADIPEQVREGVTGFLVRPGDPELLADRLLHLVRDPAERQRMGQAGRRRAIESFDLDVVARRCVSLWTEAVENHRARSSRKSRILPRFRSEG
jgi:glycosyltransferase involved in cell wall biosynthesis